MKALLKSPLVALCSAQVNTHVEKKPEIKLRFLVNISLKETLFLK